VVASDGDRINQGDVCWYNPGPPRGSAPGYQRPFVVVQNNLLNHSRLATVVLCALTSNLRLAEAPGNVALRAGEADLPRASVVNVTQLFTADKRELGERLGTLSPNRVQQIVAGLRLVLEPRERG
jgi:mRNA interferase MazF